MTNEIQSAIKRIEEMEKKFERGSQVFTSASEYPKKDENLKEDIRTLSDYLSGEWLHDHELDEKRLLPEKLKRGVLSEDGLYNLLCDIKQSGFLL